MSKCKKCKEGFSYGYDNIIPESNECKELRSENEDSLTKKAVKTAGVAGVGGAVGYGAVAAFGLTAGGMVGGGAGIGAAAGPIGAVAGSIIGIAIFGLKKIFWG